MKKNSTKGYVILGILFVLISIIAFAVPTVKTAIFWIAYVFTAAAFAAQIGIWKTALGKEGPLKSKFLGFPVVHIGIVYAIIQTVAFAVFLFVPSLPVWWTFLRRWSCPSDLPPSYIRAGSSSGRAASAPSEDTCQRRP